MEDVLTLTKLDQLKTLADPLRQQLLEVFSGDPVTTKQVADYLGEKPSRLYHHVALLEQAGMIQLIETRQNRGTTERYYQAVAKRFHIDRELLEFSGDSSATSEIHALVLSALEDTLLQFQKRGVSDILETPSTEGKLVFVRTQSLRVSPEQIADLRNRVHDWLDACEQSAVPSDTQDQDISHELTLVLYPVLGEKPVSEQPADLESSEQKE